MLLCANNPYLPKVFKFSQPLQQFSLLSIQPSLRPLKLLFLPLTGCTYSDNITKQICFLRLMYFFPQKHHPWALCDPKRLEWQTPGCAGWQHHILYPDYQHSTPQGSTLRPILYSLCNCMCIHSSSTKIKCGDNTNISWVSIRLVLCAFSICA